MDRQMVLVDLGVENASGRRPTLPRGTCISLEYTKGMSSDDPLDSATGFDWDEADIEKNWERHRVAFWEVEERFFNEPLLVRLDAAHSARERRYAALGHTDAGRLLFIAFTVRRHLVRVISTRDMTRKENRIYDHAKA